MDPKRGTWIVYVSFVVVVVDRVVLPLCNVFLLAVVVKTGVVTE